MGIRIHRNAFEARASLQTQLGMLTALPHNFYWILGAWEGTAGMGGKGMERTRKSGQNNFEKGMGPDRDENPRPCAACQLQVS